jgi:hypothetical protein
VTDAQIICHVWRASGNDLNDSTVHEAVTLYRADPHPANQWQASVYSSPANTDVQ